MKLEKLFAPLKIGSVTIPNRLVVPAMVTNYNTRDGMVTDRYIRYMEEKAKGGWGLIITEDYCVQPHAKGYSRIPGLYKDDQIPANKKLTDTIHQYDSKIFCQMYHPGRQASPVSTDNHQPAAPSAIECPVCQYLPAEMTQEDIRQLVKDFGKAARRAKEAGFDGIELHCAHGYLLAEFLSPFVNKRTDKYGGVFQNRLRIVQEVYDEIRKNVGDDFPLSVRISGEEYVTGGRTAAESYELAAALEDMGFDAIHVSNGTYATPADKTIIAPMFTNHALNMDAAENIKKLVNIPVICTNRINDPQMAETLLKLEKADLIGMGRGSLCDPHLPEKAREGKMENIKMCIGCLQGCEMSIMMDGDVTCLVNPRVGREWENEMEKAEVPKKVMVVGAGPAGLTAAETAALQGHQVSLYEARDFLGGQFHAAAYPVGKGELSTLPSTLRANLEAMGVPVYFNTAVDEDLIAAEKPDAIILATGARPLMPPVPGLDKDIVVTAEDVLLGKAPISQGPVAVCGGGEVGCETAEFIAQAVPDVTVIEMRDDVLLDMDMMNKSIVYPRMLQSGVKVRSSTKVKEIQDDGVLVINPDGTEEKLPAGIVVSAFGYRNWNPLEEIARKYCPNVQVVGGAVKAGNAVPATREGYEAGLNI